MNTTEKNGSLREINVPFYNCNTKLHTSSMYHFQSTCLWQYGVTILGRSSAQKWKLCVTVTLQIFLGISKTSTSSDQMCVWPSRNQYCMLKSLTWLDPLMLMNHRTNLRNILYIMSLWNKYPIIKQTQIYLFGKLKPEESPIRWLLRIYRTPWHEIGNMARKLCMSGCSAGLDGKTCPTPFIAEKGSKQSHSPTKRVGPTRAFQKFRV